MTWKEMLKKQRIPFSFSIVPLYVWLATPSTASLLWSLPPVVLGVLLRAYASGYLNKQVELTMTGPYAYIRHPLYLGSALIAFGFACASCSWMIAAIFSIMYTAFYFPTIEHEERFLHERFIEFETYAAQVPRFIPLLTKPKLPMWLQSFSLRTYLLHREYNVILGALMMYVAMLGIVILGS